MPRNDELIPTRASLLLRLKDWQDHESWHDFFETYWELIYSVARKAGLSDDESQEVVQETLVSVAKHIPNFKYDPALGSFKTWLLNMARWRIISQFRKRPRGETIRQKTRTSPIDDVADPNSVDIDAMWDAEWRENMLFAAMNKLKHRADPLHIQVFEFLMEKDWPAKKIAERFGISIDLVYQIKHRISEELKAEVSRLEKEMT